MFFVILMNINAGFVKRKKGREGSGRGSGTERRFVSPLRRYSFRVLLSHRERDFRGPRRVRFTWLFKFPAACARNERSRRHSRIACIFFFPSAFSLSPSIKESCRGDSLLRRHRSRTRRLSSFFHANSQASASSCPRRRWRGTWQWHFDPHSLPTRN